MKKEIFYQLVDDSGINTMKLEIIMSINTVFEHEYGTYEIDEIIEIKYQINVYCYPRSNNSRLKIK